MQPTTIAGAGPVALALSQRLTAAGLTPRLVSTSPAAGWRADLLSIADAEVACAGARTLVVLARARARPARFTRAAPGDLDRLMADSLGRAARRCGVEHLVLFACGDDDPREALLRASGVPLSVLRGGGPDPAAQLEVLVRRGPGEAVVGEPWSSPRASLAPAPGVCSVQRATAPAGWSAERLANAYFAWLPAQVPTVRVTVAGSTTGLSIFGTRALLLRHLPGRSEPDCCSFEVAGGTMAGNGAEARFEFRVLLDGTTAMVTLTGYRPSLPWPLYVLTQAQVHQRLMRGFGAWLAAQA